MRNPYRVLYFVAVAILALVSFTSIVRGTQGHGSTAEKVGICHRTASDTNPYVYIEVDIAAEMPGHLGNTDPGHKPTFWKSDGTFRGVAHSDGDAKDDYLAQSKADCDDFVTEATPTPTPVVTPSETPVETPVPTQSIGEPATATPTPRHEVPNTAMSDERPFGISLFGWIAGGLFLIAGVIYALVAARKAGTR